MKSPIRVQRRRGRELWWLGRKANVTGPNLYSDMIAYSSPVRRKAFQPSGATRFAYPEALTQGRATERSQP